jgi:hypothetical protein
MSPASHHANRPATKTPSLDPWIAAVAGMLPLLKSAIHILHLPVFHNTVIISYPDFEADNSHIYRDRFPTACHEAGLEAFRGTGKLASRAALDYCNINDCDYYDVIPDLYCDEESADPTRYWMD